MHLIFLCEILKKALSFLLECSLTISNSLFNQNQYIVWEFYRRLLTLVFMSSESERTLVKF